MIYFRRSRIRRLAYQLLASARSDLLKKKYPSVPEDAIDQIEVSDPTRGKSLEWIVRQSALGNIQWPQDKQRVLKVLESFYKIKQSPKLIQQYGINPDLSKNRIQDLEALDAKVRGVSQRPEALNQAPKETKKIYDDGIYSVLKVETPGSACNLARGTKWCTSDPVVAQEYLDRDGLFIWYKGGKKFAQSSKKQIRDLKDVNLVPSEEVSLVFWKCFGILPKGVNQRIPQLESQIAQNAGEAVEYARAFLEEPWPEAEPTILKDPKAASSYARFILEERWPEAESIILKDPKAASSYARFVLHKRWPAAESTISTDPKAAGDYAAYVLKSRWPEAEPAVIKDAESASSYSSQVLKSRWSEAEPTIATNAKAAVNYALNVLKSRWPSVEPLIAKDATEAYNYAKYLLQERWPEAEPAIKRDPGIAYFYARDVIKGRWPEAESTIMDDPNSALEYAKYVIKGRWPEAESAILEIPRLAEEYRRI